MTQGSFGLRTRDFGLTDARDDRTSRKGSQAIVHFDQHGDAVDVREIDREGTTRIEVRVAQPDMGKVIGKQGRTVRALRSLVYAAGVKQHRRYVLDVVE